MAVIFRLGCSSTQKDDMFKNLGSWLCGSTCHQCKQVQQPGTVLLAPVGTLVLAHSGNFALARCCSSAPAHWNIVALAHSGNSVLAQSGIVGSEPWCTLASAPGGEHSGSSLLGHFGTILLGPSCTPVLARLCKLGAEHWSTARVGHC